MPRFSIVIPSYNNASYLPACLESLQVQTFDDWEAMVVIDASPDDAARVALDYAREDGRIHVITKESNEGRHLARRTGVAQAHGDYVLFLDADDLLAGEGVLSELARALASQPCDILRFGLRARADNGTPEETARAFEEWCNAPSGVLMGEQIVAASFSAERGYRIPWHVTHRAFKRSLVSVAFSKMTDRRLDRAEDAYEYFAIASLAGEELSRCDIVGYLYNMGAGVTNSSTLTLSAFDAEMRATQDCISATNAYAADFPSFDLRPYAVGLKHKLLETTGNEWNERVDARDKLVAADAFAAAVGRLEVDHELWRFVRDRAYELYATREQPGQDDPLSLLLEAARRHFVLQGSPDEQRRVLAMRDVAEGHVHDLRLRRLKESWDSQEVRIFVSTHKPVDLFDSSILQPVQVGAARASTRFEYTLHDDEGDTISEQNPLYCELTAQYWAWKNVTGAKYVGFCHYRRYFDFSDEKHEENPFGEVMDSCIDAESQRRYALDDASILKAVEGYDVITTGIKDLRDFPGDFSTPLEQYERAPRLHVEDLRRAMDILAKHHPDYLPDIDAFLNGNTSCFCNMFIMRRAIFDDYCAWLFPLLEEFVRTTDMSTYSREALRTPGHLSERLFNIYYLHHMRTKGAWKTRQLQCVHFTDPEPARYTLEPMRTLDDRPVVPVVFAADDSYVPMVTTTVYSMMKNASPDRHYDVMILEHNIDQRNKDIMVRFFSQFENMRLSFANVNRLVRSYKLTTNNQHISVETYYRFLIQTIAPLYDKVLYLDSDLIVRGDVSELFDTDLGDNLLAAARDVDFMGNLNMNDGIRMRYATEVMGMHRPLDYFQAGVLVLNTKAMREAHSIEEWLGFASNPAYIYNDQDVLNAHCEGRVTYLDWSWNVMTDCFNRVANVFSFAPAWAYDAYLASVPVARIVHYAGAEKPWGSPTCDRGALYWEYARETPFYERLTFRLADAQVEHRSQELATAICRSSSGSVFQHEKAVAEGSYLRRIFDPLMPVGSNRREVAKALVRFLRGRK